MKRLALILAAAGLAGCMVGPNYRQPTLPTPAAFGETAAASPVPSATGDLSRWWAALGDPTLSSLIDRALAQNLDVATAVSRLDEARAQVAVARAALFPSASGSFVPIRRDAESGASGGGGQGGSTGGSSSASGSSGSLFGALPKHLSLYSLGADASWELDIFGGTRRSVEAARAQAEASQWQARDAQVAVTAEVARAYLSLRQAQARKAEAQADVARLGDLLNLVGARFRSGLNTDLDVNQQRNALQARQAEIPQLDQQARSAIHALGVLLGEPPMTLDAELSPVRPLPAEPTALPAGLPSELLLRRPDVRVAERRLAAATAQIGVAVADRYPKIDLLGLASFASGDLGDLLSSRNFSTIEAADASVPIFDFGRRRATVAERRAQAQQAEIAYRQAWLGALRDVEDALSSYRANSAREALLAQDLRTAEDTSSLAEARYRAGLTPFVDVLNAEGSVNQAEDQLIQARSSRIGDAVALFTALGGGWTPEVASKAVPAAR